jgi:alpha-mannosidase
MIVNRKTILKLERLVDIYRERIYCPLSSVELVYGETAEHLRRCPGDDFLWQPAEAGMAWGGPWQSMWMKGQFKVPDDLKDKMLYIQADTGAVEALLMIDGEHKGLFNIETEEGVRGNHHTRLALMDPSPGTVHDVALECYAGHPCVGTMPFDHRDQRAFVPDTYRRYFRHVRICSKDHLTASFVTELRILLQIAGSTGSDSFRGAGIYKRLETVFRTVPQQPSDYPTEEIASVLEEAREVMKPLLEMKNGESAPRVGIIGHSHMDTAWLWTVAETRRKCARTFSNALNLMDEFPDYMFMQSVPLHLEMMKQDYPGVFEDIKRRVEEGRWEPNGGSWVEPDCNIPSGESLTRHFLYGQSFLKEELDYRADQFWMPDVFGYSASIPQILKLCGISGFLTTKLSWNEENRFPYDTFLWSGIDGTQVLTHFNTSHCWPDPETLVAQTMDIQHKDIQDSRLCSFGYGDGGGGPLTEMLEAAPYLKDIEGVPRTEYTTVSRFMRELAQTRDLPVWMGELYLELHRGTLTSLHRLKKMNREVENQLREAEYLCSLRSLEDQTCYPADELERLWKILLKNQFHDILPGTSITPVHETAVEELEQCRREAGSLIERLGKIAVRQDGDFTVLLENSRTWERSHLILSGLPSGTAPAGDIEWQRIRTTDDEDRLMVHGIVLPGMGARRLSLTRSSSAEGSGEGAFYTYQDNILETPFYVLKFGKHGEIVSLEDRRVERELVGKGGAVNQLMLGEDLPALWDNWDIDVDQHMRMKLLSGEGAWTIEQEGPLQIRLSNAFQAGKSSLVKQHLVLYKNSPLIEFDTKVDWQEEHKLLKAEFDLAVQIDRARHEIQYGHLERSTHENHSQDRMQFEVSNHRWTDLSEPGYGVALLNDCKYGISVKGSTMGLSLLKSGTHPDPSADRGIHSFRYALLPHDGPFSTASVIRPACEFNSPLTVLSAESESEPDSLSSFLSFSEENLLVESIKQAEDGDGLIVRFYESEKKQTRCSLSFSSAPAQVWECNMLEEKSEKQPIDEDGSITMNLHGFEIKTLRIIW